MQVTLLSLLFFLLLPFNLFSQVVNGYAKVTAISSATLTLSNVNEAADSFENGEWVVLMQMQGNVIGTTTDVIGFGNLSSINSTGLYEIRQIDSHTETAGVPTTITLKNIPNYTYNICTNCSVQIITFRQFGSPNYTTTSSMSALPWNGNVGGVLAFYVNGKLTLGHNLSANEAGFRGAVANTGGSLDCTGGSSFRLATGVNHADKGESIYKRTNATYAAGRAKILNGGGGGNSHNAGGGGGGNLTAGGNGGPGYPNCSPSAGGVGGISLSSEINVGRIFLGGAGGAGEGNNGFSTSGKNGGGIILIKAEEIETVACAGITISANGGSVPGTGGNDGGGGGGAGGSIVFEVETWTIAGGCPLTISANGGNGGNVNSVATHGGGGGGGQGALFFSTTAPSVNVTLETNSGDGGCNNNSVPCNSQANSGAGVNGAGIFGLLTGPLPIELVHFSAMPINRNVQLTWSTASEKNNALFIIEKSLNGVDWIAINEVSGAGNSSTIQNYLSWDFAPYIGLNYYRLKQIDFDGSYTYSDVRTVVFSFESILLYPNPAKDFLFIQGLNRQYSNLIIYDALGKMVKTITDLEDLEDLKILITDLKPGYYTLNLEGNGKSEVLRFIIAR